MESALELLPAGGRGRRNRKWPDEVKARIVAEALEAVEKALLSDRITTLDTMLFGTMKLALSTAGPISFHPIDWTNTSPDMRKLITTRLKLCGYKYSGADQVWRKQEPKPFVKLKEWERDWFTEMRA